MTLNYMLVTKLLLIVYSAALLFLVCYGIIQIHLVYLYLKRGRTKLKNTAPDLQTFPLVTVQLPVYNESLVVERLIDAVAKIEYPKDRWEIQVLDDSTDETTAMVERKVAQYKAEGLQIHHIRRTNRNGYKAGALENGLQQAMGEFITIFDADFVAPPDFLLRTLPHFSNNRIGMVQTRWTHLNKNSSLLTHFQAFLLDAHFSIEQGGRNSAGCFINFSGTGGVWRKACMLDAGGWHADTLTEDFDLSYRAQLRGWQFSYLEDVCVPAELPPVMSALKAQQFRWIKGNAETARKHVKNVLASAMPFTAKLHAFFHLMVGLVFISAFAASVLSLPLLVLKAHTPELKSWFQYASLSLISLLCLGVFHFVATVYTGFTSNQSRRYFFRTFPLYLSFSMGMAFNNAVAVAEGWLGIKSAFVRTPKYNISDAGFSFTSTPRAARLSPLLLMELLLTFYFLSGGALAFYYHDFSMLPYHLMLAFGFGMIVWFSLSEQYPQWFKIKKKRPGTFALYESMG